MTAAARERPFRRRPSIPVADGAAFGREARRTTLLRGALALALLALLGVCFLLARDLRARPSTYFAGESGVLVLDLSTSVDPARYLRLSRVVRSIVETGQRAGLVVFSDGAYEALPMGTSGEELRPLLRFFEPPVTDSGDARRAQGFGFLESPWSGTFRGGTRISNGLRAARESIERAGTAGGSVLLVSDLDDSPIDLDALTQEIIRYGQSGIELRVVPLFPGEEDREFFRGLVGERAFLTRDELLANTALEERQTLTGSLPWLLVAAAALLLLLLALNEHLCGRLSWSPGRPT